MIYDLNNNKHLERFISDVDLYIGNKSFVELKKLNKTRSLQQNKALHLWFTNISDALNEVGQTFVYKGLKGMKLETMFTPEIIKTFIIKPIIKTLFDIDSTKDLNTQMINQLIDVINNYFSERGIYLPFPDIETLISLQNENYR